MKVLFVDDDANLLVSYQRSLRKQFDIDTALGGPSALEMLCGCGPYAVIVSDMAMPGMNGIEFLNKARDASPESVRMMLTGNADLSTAVNAINSGSIFRFLLKPCLPDDLAANIQFAIDQFQLVHAEKELLEKTLHGSIKLLIEILALQNPELFGKAQALRSQIRTLAEAMRLPDIWKLELVALLSQVGLVTLPPTILQKIQSHSHLSEDEEAVTGRIPEISYNLIVNIPRLESVAEAIRNSNKHFDGTGTPRSDCAGNRIPIGARLLRVLADLADIRSQRVTAAGAIRLMRRRVGVYDPEVLDAAERCFTDWHAEPADYQTGRPITSRDLVVGMQLTSDIESKCGLLLVSAGHLLTETLLERVRNFAAISGLKEPFFVVDPVQTKPTPAQIAA